MNAILDFLVNPRNGILIVLFVVMGVGATLRLRRAHLARVAVDRLSDARLNPAIIAEAARHGRAGVPELFRILSEPAQSDENRNAAGRALLALWAADELVAEEEKGIVRRGHRVVWRARRTYPAALGRSIPIRVEVGLPFLDADAPIRPENLEWSHRVRGTGRLRWEDWTPWSPGSTRLDVAIHPDDFDGPGPKRLVLETRARAAGLTDEWEVELPHEPRVVEFDPATAVDSLLSTAPDPDDRPFLDAIQWDEPDARGVSRSESESESDDAPPVEAYPLNAEWAAVDLPPLRVAGALPRDLAHRVELEWRLPNRDEPVALDAGALIRPGDETRTTRHPFQPGPPWPDDAIQRPGFVEVRARLTPDPALGWTHPDIRAIHPNRLETPWRRARLARR